MGNNTSMAFKETGIVVNPIHVLQVNDSTIIAVYKGSLSKYDILIKYRQKLSDGGWSRIRTPKHIHWTVDILIKMQGYKKLTKKFIDFFIHLWEQTRPIDSENKRASLDLENLLTLNHVEITRFQKLSKKGEYSIRFLILLAKLLMLQEKTNMADAYMFKNLLVSLSKGKDLFDVLSKASHTGRR